MILVTGATGQIGSELVKLLGQQGSTPVRVFVRDAQKAANLKDTGIEVAAGDFDNIGSLDAALDDVDQLFLLTTASTDMVALQNGAIDLAKERGVKHIVKLSAFGAEADSPCFLTQTHYHIEQHLKASGLAYTILQPTFFMQNLLGDAQGIKEQGKFYHPMTAKMAHVDYRDIAAVAAGVLLSPGAHNQTYVITGPEALTYDEVAQKIGAAIGQPVEHVTVGFDDYKQSLLGYGIPEWMAQGFVTLAQQFDGGKGDTVTDTVERVGHKQPTSLDQFIQENLAAYKG